MEYCTDQESTSSCLLSMIALCLLLSLLFGREALRCFLLVGEVVIHLVNSAPNFDVSVLVQILWQARGTVLLEAHSSFIFWLMSGRVIFLTPT